MAKTLTDKQMRNLESVLSSFGRDCPILADLNVKSERMSFTGCILYDKTFIGDATIYVHKPYNKEAWEVMRFARSMPYPKASPQTAAGLFLLGPIYDPRTLMTYYADYLPNAEAEKTRFGYRINLGLRGIYDLHVNNGGLQKIEIKCDPSNRGTPTSKRLATITFSKGPKKFENI